MTAVFNQLGPYEILDEIGRGGMAQVFLARDTRSDKRVALKVVPPGKDHEAREILEAERSGAELQRQFSEVSAHVPAVYEHGEDESGYFLVAMEYLDGENLSDVIARGAIPPERAVQIAIDLCACLEMAHRFEPVNSGRPLRLVHGDLKPRNVRVTSSGAVKVLDFGIAKALSLSRKVTRNDFGTMPYLSPERLETAEVNEFADLWAVGVMLYEMIRGARPFEAPDTQRLERLIRARIPPLPLATPCPAGLEAIVAKLLGPSPSARYGGARAVREDLERFTSGARTIAEEQGWPDRACDSEPTRRSVSAGSFGSASAAGFGETRRDPTAAAAATSHAPAFPVDEATRRTRPPVARKSPPPTRPRRASRRVLLAVLSVLVLGLISNECSVANAARSAAADVSTRELDELPDAWRVYATLAQRSRLGFGPMHLEHALRERTLVLAEKIIANYRMALPTVRETQWESARNALARAIPVASGDRRLRAAFHYCDGHLHRINGEAHKRRHEDADAQRELAEAVAAFREAADLRTNWPDPFLGLARTFIYGLEDIDRGADALDQAARRGYVPAERETGQLADGYRARGDSLVRSARKLSDMPQESDYLTRAVEAYQRALSLYPQASNLSSGPQNIRLTQRALDQAQRRLDEITLAAAAPAEEPAPSDSDTPPPDSHVESPDAAEDRVL
jgi:serine/threonine protein kinase